MFQGGKEMLNLAEQNKIRDLFFNQGQSISEIKRITGFDRKTIRKYIKFEATLNKPKKNKINKSFKIDLYKNDIDSWMEEDRKAKRKQRHTAKRIHDRLAEKYGDSFNCSYRTVANYVAERKKDMFQNNKSYLPLKHFGGEAQVDFGKAEFIENGIKYSGSYLVLSFPHSNAGYLQVFKGETAECLFQGLMNIFKHINGVPTKLWFDNMSSIVISIKKNGERKLTDDFLKFQQFFGFSTTFCNPNSGNEKGNVEKKVGYLRKNMLVPIPEFKEMDKFNEELLIKCDNDLNRPHYAKELLISKLFEKDKSMLIYLPETEYEVARYEKVRTDSYGKFTLNSGKHSYSTAPKFAREYILVKITANYVIPLDKDFKEIVTHQRMFGTQNQESMNWLPYLTQLSRKPRALKYSGIYDLFPETVKSVFDSTENHSEILKTMVEISNKSNFETSLRVVEIAIEHNKFDKESLTAVYNRIMHNGIEFPDIKLPKNTPKLAGYQVDLSKYDDVLLKGCESLC